MIKSDVQQCNITEVNMADFDGMLATMTGHD